MWKLSRVKIFDLLLESSLVTNLEMKHAYEAFVKELVTLDQPETDYQTVFRSLNLIRIEFQSLQTHTLCEQGGKCAKESVLSESYCCC